jgi:hypothetical protein
MADKDNGRPEPTSRGYVISTIAILSLFLIACAIFC